MWDTAKILDGGRAPKGEPSTIVDITGSTPRVLREGAVTTAEVAEVLDVDPASLVN